jgi:hypothetical protein
VPQQPDPIAGRFPCPSLSTREAQTDKMSIPQTVFVSITNINNI